MVAVFKQYTVCSMCLPTHDVGRAEDKVVKSRAWGEWFTSFTHVLSTSSVGLLQR